MEKSSMSFLKGIGTGMIAGATAVTVGKMVLKERKSLSKGSAKILNAVSDFVDGIHTMFN